MFQKINLKMRKAGIRKSKAVTLRSSPGFSVLTLGKLTSNLWETDFSCFENLEIKEASS